MLQPIWDQNSGIDMDGAEHLTLNLLFLTMSINALIAAVSITLKDYQEP